MNNSAGDCSISNKFSTDSDHVTPDLPQNLKVNGSSGVIEAITIAAPSNVRTGRNACRKLWYNDSVLSKTIVLYRCATGQHARLIGTSSRSYGIVDMCHTWPHSCMAHQSRLVSFIARYSTMHGRFSSPAGCNIRRCAQRCACTVEDLLLRGPVRNAVASCVRKSFTDNQCQTAYLLQQCVMDWLNCLTVLLRVICLTLLVICLHADYFLSVCLSPSLFLYLYFVYDFYTVSQKNVPPWNSL